MDTPSQDDLLGHQLTRLRTLVDRFSINLTKLQYTPRTSDPALSPTAAARASGLVALSHLIEEETAYLQIFLRILEEKSKGIV